MKRKPLATQTASITQTRASARTASIKQQHQRQYASYLFQLTGVQGNLRNLMHRLPSSEGACIKACIQAALLELAYAQEFLKDAMKGKKE